jgi:hypothetical protein
MTLENLEFLGIGEKFRMLWYAVVLLFLWLLMKKIFDDIRELGSLGLGKISECYGMLLY